MRAYIVIGALVFLAISAGIYAANTQIKQASPGYRWTEQRGIDDEDYCLNGDNFFHRGCVANVVGSSGADNGIGVPPPLSPDDDDDDNN